MKSGSEWGFGANAAPFPTAWQWVQWKQVIISMAVDLFNTSTSFLRIVEEHKFIPPATDWLFALKVQKTEN